MRLAGRLEPSPENVFCAPAPDVDMLTFHETTADGWPYPSWKAMASAILSPFGENPGLIAVMEGWPGFGTAAMAGAFVARAATGMAAVIWEELPYSSRTVAVAW